MRTNKEIADWVVGQPWIEKFKANTLLFQKLAFDYASHHKATDKEKEEHANRVLNLVLSGACGPATIHTGFQPQFGPEGAEYWEDIYREFIMWYDKRYETD